MFKQTSPRSIVVIIHRYVGLTIVSFLLMAGLTGSILTFHHQLDAALNPTLFRATPPSPDAKPLEPLILRERLVQHLSGRPLPQVVLEFQPEASVSYRVRADVGDDQFFLDPYTGIILGSRRWGDLSQGLVNLLPFIFRLHMNLALGEVGRWLLGIVALLWTLDCFIGMYLTFPNRRTAASLTTTSAQRSWLARWKPAWFMTGNSLFGTIFTLHRASGLWAWPLLFIVAWSSVGFNLRPVYQPVMSTLFTTIDINATLPKRTPPRTAPALSWPEALNTARRLMNELATQQAFTLGPESRLTYDPRHGLYRYDVHSSRDLSSINAGTRLWFDGDHGTMFASDMPTGISVGNTLHALLTGLHRATIGALPYRIVSSIFGLTVVALCLSGVVIWWRKRRARIDADQRCLYSSPNRDQI